MNKKIFFGILILAIIVMVVIFNSKKDVGELQKINIDSGDLVSNEQNNLYLNQKYNFSFNIPDGFDTREFDEDGNHVILLEGGGKSIQVLISDYDEGNNLTVDRIKKDLPDMKIESPKEIKINGGGGVLFKGDNQEFGGETLEAWFVYGMNLYQVTTSVDQIENLNVIITSWKFEL